MALSLQVHLVEAGGLTAHATVRILTVRAGSVIVEYEVSAPPGQSLESCAFPEK